MDSNEYMKLAKPILVVNCDLLYGKGRSIYTLIYSMIYADNPNEDVLVCNVPAEECKDIEFNKGSRQGYMSYAEIPLEHRVANLPLVPWYKKKLSYIPENGSILLS